MARSRNIKPGFFENEDLSEVPKSARLLFIGLWTISDRRGVLEYRPKRIKAQIFPYDDGNVQEIIDEIEQLEKFGFLKLYTSNNVELIYIAKFSKHQSPHPKEKENGHKLPKNSDCSKKVSDKSVTKKTEVSKKSVTSHLQESDEQDMKDERVKSNDESGKKKDESLDLGLEIAEFYKNNINSNEMASGKKNLTSLQKKSKISFEDLFTRVKNYHEYLTINKLAGTQFTIRMRNFFGRDARHEDYIEKPVAGLSRPQGHDREKNIYDTEGLDYGEPGAIDLRKNE